MVLRSEARGGGDSMLLTHRCGHDEPVPPQRASTVPTGGCGGIPDPGHLRLAKFHAPEIVFGPGSLPEAAYAAVRLGARRPMLVADPGLLAAGWPDELLFRWTFGAVRG